MKKGWFFGDSFTAGVNATPGLPYYEWAGGGETFSKLLCRDFNVEEINKGLPGKCNNSIINSIIENLKSIKKGDLVVISNTSPVRDLVPVSTDYRSHEDYKFGLTSQKLFNSSQHEESIGYNDKDVNFTLTEYALKVRAPYTSEWNAYYRNIYVNFVKYFITIGCNAIFWDYSVWSEDEEIGTAFETIVDATKGEIFDLHWSFKGHRDAYTWIKSGLDSSTIFLQFPHSKKNRDKSWLLT